VSGASAKGERCAHALGGALEASKPVAWFATTTASEIDTAREAILYAPRMGITYLLCLGV